MEHRASDAKMRIRMRMRQRMQAQRARLAHRLFFPPHDQAMALRFYAARIRADATDLIARSNGPAARVRPRDIQDNDGSRRD
jgi:hypothetical protein